MTTKAQHTADVQKAAPAFAAGLQRVLASQKQATKSGQPLDPAAETAATKAAIMPAVTQAVGIGAQRVASAVGSTDTAPNTGLAATLAYDFANQYTATTQNQVQAAQAQPDATEDDTSGVFDARDALAAAVAATVISGAINAGSAIWAEDNPDDLDGAQKMWVVGDDNPCPDCDIDGETVNVGDDFSNGAPHGPIHSNCSCTTAYVPGTTDSRSREMNMDEETRLATYEDEVRAKYSADDLKAMAAKGQAMKNANGDPSYPIADEDDLDKAIKAVGRGGADHDAIRKHIIARAAALNLSAKVPDNWNADGSLKQENAADTDGEERDVSTAAGSMGDFSPPKFGTGMDENGDTCARCEGTGAVDLGQGDIPCPLCVGDDDSPELASGANQRRPRRRQRRDLARTAEHRMYSAKIEMRAGTVDDGEVVLHGMPIRFDSPYDVRDMVGLFSETMKPGVADQVLEARDLDCRFLENHEGRPMARTLNGTLTLTSTPEGIVSEARVDTRRSDSRDLALAVERGDITQMSCGFVVGEDDWTLGADGTEQRDIYSFRELFDVSAVTYPASPTTTIEIAKRALMGISDESRERLRSLWHIAKDIREGKVLSQQNGQQLMEALEALHEADDIDIPGIVKSLEVINAAVDAGQAGLSAVLGRSNPDGDADDLQPALVAPDGDDDKRMRQRQKLLLMRSRDLLVP